MDASTDSGPWAAAANELGPVAAGLTLLRRPTVIGQVGSTQDELRRLADAGAPSGTVLIAARQTRGRGRAGRDWDDASRPGASLAMSLLLELPRVGAGLVPHAIGVGVVDALRAMSDVDGPVRRIGLKWPNDVVLLAPDADTMRKLAGTLVERERCGGRDVLLVGLGLNVDRRSERLSADRACLASTLAADVPPGDLLARLLPAIDRALGALDEPRGLLALYRERCVTIGRHVSIDRPGAQRLTGRAVDVDEEGRLVVMNDIDGVVTVVAGTVRDADGTGPVTGAGAFA